MRVIKALILCALITSASIAIAQDVKTDHNHSVDFSKYRTYMWIKEPQPEDPLMKQRIVDAVNGQLAIKGLRLVSASADLGVSANTSTMERHTLDSFYNGFPGDWRWRHWGPSPGFAYVDTYEVGTLIVDLFDTNTKQVVWRGSAMDTVHAKAEKNTKHLNKAVEKMFKDFPPEGDTTN